MHSKNYDLMRREVPYDVNDIQVKIVTKCTNVTNFNVTDFINSDQQQQFLLTKVDYTKITVPKNTTNYTQ
jgi:hypothetical protein